MDDLTLRKMYRAIEVWRRGTQLNTPTRDCAQDLVDKLADQGFTLSEGNTAEQMVKALEDLGYNVIAPAVVGKA